MTAELISRRRYRRRRSRRAARPAPRPAIAAAVQVYGERGYQNATVKAVCEAAGLTERYFYESFANSEALLLASFETVTHRLLLRIEQAGEDAGGDGEHRALAILRAYFGTLQCEPRSARVFLVEIRGVSRLVDEALGRSLREFGGLLARTLLPGAPGAPIRCCWPAWRAASSTWRCTGFVTSHVPDVDTVAATALQLALVLRAGARD